MSDAKPKMNYIRAINQAHHDAMAADDSVIVIGEDVGAAGGPFKATRGLLDAFGRERVRDTPISEAAIMSAAVGAAMCGLKPIVEIMFMDFLTLAADGLVNQAAKARFMFGGRRSVPMVVRTAYGGGLNAGAQHSQCLEAWVAHIPGLKVVCPSTPGEAYALLRAAIDDPDPVVYVEHKAMYGQKGELDATRKVQIGKAAIVRKGRDATIVTYGSTVKPALAAAELMATEGYEIEVIDLRSIQPWDEACVFASVARTHRVVVVHEAVQAFGVGAEIAARIAEDSFDELDAPVVRVGAPFMPIGFGRSLEAHYMVNAEKIVAGLRKTLR